MRAILCLGIIATPLLGIGSAYAADTGNTSCRVLIIGLSNWRTSQCNVEERGDVLTLSWSISRTQTYRVDLALSDDGQSAQAAWNGIAAAATVDTPLGRLTQSGDCWTGDTATLCFTRPGHGNEYIETTEEAGSYDPEIAQEIAGDEEEAERALANEAAGQGGAGAALANASSFRGLQLGMTPSQVVAALPQPMILAAERAGGDVLQELTGFAEQFTPGAGPRIKGFIVNNQSTCGEVTFVDARVDRLRLYQCFFNIPAGMTIEDFVQQVIDNYRIEDGMSGRWEMLGDGPYRFKYTEYVGVRREASERFTASLHEMNGVLTLTVERIPSVNFN